MSKLPRRSVGALHQDEPLELENHFILRLPAETAEKVRDWLQEGGAAFKDRLFINFQPDMRHAQVKVDKEVFYGKLVDLPCIIETLKTLDKKTFYKVADVAQMLVCKTERDKAEDDHKDKTEAKDPKKKDKQYQMPHGITAPLKNVRKRRFRKTLKKKYMDAPELEKELKRLLREDMEAVKVKWEIVTPEQEAQQKLKAQKQKHPDQQGPSTSGVQSTVGLGDTVPPMSQVDELFGGALSSSSDDDDSRPPSDVEPLPDSDADLDTTNHSVPVSTPGQQRGPESVTNQMMGEDEDDVEGRELAQQLMIPDATDEKPPEIDSESLRMRVMQLQSELMQMEKTRKNYEMEASRTDDPGMKERLQQDIRDLVKRDKQIRDEVAALKREIQRKP